MVLADGVPFAFDHAWCVNAASEHVIQSALPGRVGLACLGIALTDDYRRGEQARRGVDAVTPAAASISPTNTDALRGGLPSHARLSVGTPASSTLGQVSPIDHEKATASLKSAA
jgi:hypothetical protein